MRQAVPLEQHFTAGDRRYGYAVTLNMLTKILSRAISWPSIDYRMNQCSKRYREKYADQAPQAPEDQISRDDRNGMQVIDF